LIEKNKMYTRYGKKREESLIDVVKWYIVCYLNSLVIKPGDHFWNCNICWFNSLHNKNNFYLI
jgi:hypothetical protein